MTVIHKLICPKCKHVTTHVQYAMYNMTCEKCGYIEEHRHKEEIKEKKDFWNLLIDYKIKNIYTCKECRNEIIETESRILYVNPCPTCWKIIEKICDDD